MSVCLSVSVSISLCIPMFYNQLYFLDEGRYEPVQYGPGQASGYRGEQWDPLQRGNPALPPHRQGGTR